MKKFILLVKYIIIAIVQGIGEILPISSSGHMIIITRVLNLNPDLSFEIFLHFASLIAIIVFFRKRLLELIKDFFLFIFKKNKITEQSSEIEKEKAFIQKKNFLVCIYLIIATIPAGIAGILLDDLIEQKLSTFLFVGLFLLITALLLFISTLIKRNKTLENMKWYDALIIGLFQCIGIFPGISRSGACIVGGASRKLNQSGAAEFAFLMAIPIMAGSALIKVNNIFTSLVENKSLIIPYIVSFIVAALMTFICLKLIFKHIKKIKMSYFSLYCVLMGIVCLVLHFIW